MDMICAPWTDSQVEYLTAFQRSEGFHPFTCGYRDDHYQVNEGILIATKDGWVCPYGPCTYTQNWAHGFMADSSWLTYKPWRQQYRDEQDRISDV